MVGNDVLSKKMDLLLAPNIDIDRQQLANLLDAEALQSMMDDLYSVTKTGFAIIDLKGNVLAAAGWQDICTKFHRVNPMTLWNCLESDLVLTEGVRPGEFRTYKCKNNMCDIVTPIFIGKKHVGNLFSGQFFFDDETVDREAFAKQAELYGFDKAAYMEALDRVPRWNRVVVQNLMRFYSKLSGMISKLSYTNLKLSKTLVDQRLIERELRDSQHDLNRAQSVAKTGSWRLNIQSNQLLWSDETYRLFQVPKGTPLNYESFLKFVHPEDREMVNRAWKAALRGQGYDIEHRILVEDKISWVREKAELEFAEDGSLVSGFGTVQDISERKINEHKLRRLNRALRAISNSNQVLMRATDEAAFLQQGCRIIVEDCGYKLVWIGFAEENEEKTVKPMAYAGFDQGYIDALKICWADNERGRGPTGRAIRTAKPQICNDLESDPTFAPWRKAALERGYASSIVLPLISEGRAFGALNIYSHQQSAFSDDEIKLLVELASDLSYGITLLRTRAAAKKTQAALRDSEERFSKAFSENPAAVAITRLIDGRYLDVNQNFLDLFGYTREEVVDHTSTELNIFVDPVSREDFLEIINKSGKVRNFEMTFRNKKGMNIPTLLSVEKLVLNGEDHIISTLIDITERKGVENAISKAKEEWERTFDALPDLIAIIDYNHRVLRVNKAMAEHLGVKPEYCFGLKCYQCVHGCNLPPEFCPHTKTLQDGEQHTAEVHEERLGGDFLVTTTPLRDGDGRIFASVHVARDINRHKNTPKK